MIQYEIYQVSDDIFRSAPNFNSSCSHKPYVLYNSMSDSFRLNNFHITNAIARCQYVCNRVAQK